MAASLVNMAAFDWDTAASDYLHLVNNFIPGPQSWTYFVPHILLPASLVVSPDILSHHALATLVFPIILASTIHAFIAMRGPDVISADTLWWSLYFLVLQDPRHDFKRIVEKTKDRRTKSPGDHQDGIRSANTGGTDKSHAEWSYSDTTLTRLKWAFTLLSERPLTSWKIGRFSHDATVSTPYIRQTRVKFVKDIITILLPAVFLIMPLALRLHALEPQISSWPNRENGTDSVADRNAALDLLPRFSVLGALHRLIPAHLLRSLTTGMFLYSFLVVFFLQGYLLPPLLSLLINPASGANHTWSPHLWPRPHFGPFSAVLDTGLRGLWGKWWHQQMRHAVSEPGRWLSDKFGLRSGLVRYGIICMSAFVLSGITHMGLVPPDLPAAWETRLKIGAFFFVQPVGILLEVVIVERFLRRLEVVLKYRVMPTGVIRMLRLCWVLLFMSFPLTFLAAPFEALGYWSVWPPSFLHETAKSVLRGDWIP